ncbi:sugar ABC transporter permease [Enterococcus saccharolyticus]|uniref:carbohydrate ABC transporter permease n=1 Tax=Enterococcus saccharolyticus TaxID=41997 RepID=UPI001E5C12CA|nr:sugar ABC transporter permease [Enterococcus saccharolyticus]MCD5002903.1 sugar ABC transporter permease [Enterococcus saccharolyticus]
MRKNNLTFWLFLTPALLSLTLVIIVPLVLGTYYSFTDWNGVGSYSFIVFSNYTKLFADDTFKSALWFTIKFSIVTVISLNVLGLGLAMLVTQKLKVSNTLRTVFFMPNLIGGLILGFIWQFIFVRVFSSIGEAVGMDSLVGWLSTTTTGFWGLVILTCWQMGGYIMIIYIAYLQNVPNELMEAADIDGASAIQKFRFITFPLIAPAFTVSMFLTLSNSFKVYDQNLSLTNGGPYNSTEMLAMNIVKTAFVNNDMSYGQAKSLIFFVIVAIISLTQVYYNKKREVEM